MCIQTTYSLFGVTLAADLLESRLVPVEGIPKLHLSHTSRDSFVNAWKTSILYKSPLQNASGESVMYLYSDGACDILDFPGIARFYLWPTRILWHHLDMVPEKRLIETYLLASVFPFWLERHNIPILHASAIVVDAGVVGFLSHSGHGKSALAAGLMQVGFSLLTDDVLPVEAEDEHFLGRSGYPWMRMWPDEAQHFLGYYESLERVHPEVTKRWVPVGRGGFGGFCSKSQPLRCIYVPERCTSENGQTHINIVPLSPRDAALELLRYSFMPRIVDAIGIAPQRLKLFAQLVQQVPVRRLVYPSGFEHLPAVREAILEDLARSTV